MAFLRQQRLLSTPDPVLANLQVTALFLIAGGLILATGLWGAASPAVRGIRP
jgi:hypothetical protein